MNLAFIAEHQFWREVAAGGGQLWVARNSLNGIHTLELIRAGLSLPVWSSLERTEVYLRQARLIGPPCTPHPVALVEFIPRWLHDRRLAVAELLINPDGRSVRMLVMSVEEFCVAAEASCGPEAR